MCLPNSDGYSCVCPVGLKIKKDGKTCASSADNLLLFARKKDLRLMPLDQATRAFDTVIPVDNIANAIGLTWLAEDNTIFWTDLETKTISKAFLNGTNQTVVIAHNLGRWFGPFRTFSGSNGRAECLGSPVGIAMDWITRKLYWTDSTYNRIECSNLDGTMRAVLVHKDLDKPRDIAVDPTSTYDSMYMSSVTLK